MSIDTLLEQLLIKLKAEQAKSKSYLQGYEDAMAEVVFLLEKHKKLIKPDSTKKEC